MIGILINIALQLFYFILSIYICGFIISLINRKFYGLFANSRAVIYATGFIGTPIHESSHALMCLLFAHKINEIKFFQMDDESGVLGYVKHSYKPKNYYAVVGNYFIGVAPILAGCAILSLSFYFLLPQTYLSIRMISVAQGSDIFKSIGSALKSFFSEIVNWRFWVLLIVNLCIALHMNLSDADIKGSLKALPILGILLIAVNLVLGFVWPRGYATFVSFVNGAGLKVMIFLLFSVGFAFLYLLLGLIVRSIIKKAVKGKLRS